MDIDSDQVVIAAGARPVIPPAVVAAGAHYETSDTIMRIARPPWRLAVLGGCTPPNSRWNGTGHRRGRLPLRLLRDPGPGDTGPEALPIVSSMVFGGRPDPDNLRDRITRAVTAIAEPREGWRHVRPVAIGRSACVRPVGVSGTADTRENGWGRQGSVTLRSTSSERPHSVTASSGLRRGRSERGGSAESSSHCHSSPNPADGRVNSRSSW